MSTQALTQLLEEIARDPTAWQRDSNAMMSRYDLSESEQRALRSGDADALRTLGVDERLTKGMKRG
jgi:hypothetical protein